MITKTHLDLIMDQIAEAKEAWIKEQCCRFLPLFIIRRIENREITEAIHNWIQKNIRIEITPTQENRFFYKNKLRSTWRYTFNYDSNSR